MNWISKQLTDDAYSSSSHFDRYHAAKFSRLNSTEGKANWSSKINDKKQWLQINLGTPKKIIAVAVQGRFNHPQWVTKYDLLISSDLKIWEEIKNITGVNDQDSISVFQLKKPFIGQYIRFVPVEWNGHISMRADVALSEDTIFWIGKNLEDFRYSSSSDWDEKHSAKLARLNLSDGQANWSSKINDDKQWIQIKLEKNESIVAVAVQGRFNHKQWVSKYDLLISEDSTTWKKYENINGSSDQDSIVEFWLPHACNGRFVRFIPKEWHNHISMRIDVCIQANLHE